MSRNLTLSSEIHVATLSGLAARQRDDMAAYYRKLPETTKVEIESLVAKLANKNRRKMQQCKSGEFFYAMRLRAIHAYRDKEAGFTRKEDMTPASLQELTEIRIKSILATQKKPGKTTLADIVRIRYDELAFLRRRGLSWRNVAEYLKRYTNTLIHYTYLCECFNQITKEIEQND